MKTIAWIAVLLGLAAGAMGGAADVRSRMRTKPLPQEGEYRPKAEPRFACISPDGKRIAVVEANTVTMRNLKGRVLWTYKPPRKVEGYDLTASYVEHTAVGITMVTLLLSEPGECYPFEVQLVGLDEAGHPRWKRTVDGEAIPAESGHIVLWTDFFMPKTFGLFDARTGRTIWSRQDECVPTGAEVALSPDGEYLAISLCDKATVIDKTGRTVWSRRVQARRLAVANGGRRVAVCMESDGQRREHKLAVFDSAGKELWKKDLVVSPMRLSDNGERLLAVVVHRGIILLNASTGDVLWEQPEGLGEPGVWPAPWISPDGKRSLFSLEREGSRTLYLLESDVKLSRLGTLPGVGRVWVSSNGEGLMVQEPQAKRNVIRTYRIPRVASSASRGKRQ